MILKRAHFLEDQSKEFLPTDRVPRLAKLEILTRGGTSRWGGVEFFHNPQPYQLSLPAATAWQERFAKDLRTAILGSPGAPERPWAYMGP